MLVHVPSHSVRVWLDPCCPWAWQVANWLEEVSSQRQVDIDYRIMSLALLSGNSARRHDPFMETSLTLTLLLVATREEFGANASKRLYTALAKRIHKGPLGSADALISESLSECSLPPDIAARSKNYHKQLQESTSTALSLVGDQCGTPVVSVGDVAFFGPVISRVPRGEDALKLFDGVVSVCAFDGFYELKRTRSEGPQID